ncbi:MAG: hypothetical protein NPINA01_32330 [Nitrospinaceae bacterium]|nr:MAG: hypothetical protein NPINA01_32330 [Nitrospinaceae bacterium]
MAWSPVAWDTIGEAGPDQRTPDITAVIQEIVDQGGWVSGNSLAVIISGTGERVADSFEGDSSGAALLHVVFTTGGTPPTASGGGPHAVKVAGPHIYGYDANGNMTSGGGRTIEYDIENRPTSIVSGGTTTTFVYDGDGGRVKKTAGSATTVYIGKLYVCENGACTRMIFAGGTRVAQKEVTGGAVSFYHPDHLGSTGVVTNAAGNNEQDLAYYPYGDTFLDVGSQDVRFKYTGKEKDDSTGLYFYEARYYDPFLGRFIQADTIVPDPLDSQSLNRYSYALNNPILYIDPSGNFSIGSLFGFVGSFIETLVNGGSLQDAFINGTISGVAWGVSFGVSGFVSPVVGQFAGAIIGASAGAAASSAVARAAGRDVNIGQTVGFAALGAAAGGAVGAIGGPDGLPWGADIVASGLVGGGVSEIAGGNFADGFGSAAIASAVSHYGDIADVISELVETPDGTPGAKDTGGFRDPRKEFPQTSNEGGNEKVAVLPAVIAAANLLRNGAAAAAVIAKYGSKIYKQAVRMNKSRIGLRVNKSTRKAAEQRARMEGKGKKPINHANPANGDRPHFHPNVPKNHPKRHDHYYYPKR